MKKIIANKYFLLLFLALIVILVSGIINSVFSTYFIENAGVSLAEKEMSVARFVHAFIDKSEDEIKNESSRIEREILKLKSADQIEILEIINKNKTSFHTNIFDSLKIIGWNNNEVVTAKELNSFVDKWGFDNPFFYETPLITYFIEMSKFNSYRLLVAQPIQKKYFLNNKHFDKLSLKNTISENLEVGVDIVFNNNQSADNSKPIINSNKVIIGNFQITGISNDTMTEKLAKYTDLIQSLLLFFIICLLLILGYKSKSIKEPFLKLLYSTASLILLRILFSLLNIGDNLSFQELVSPIYFSSSFILGLAKSPIELFLTVLTALVISINIFWFLPKSIEAGVVKSKLKWVVLILLLLSVVLIYNGFASTIKSIIFDSSILYFKDASLFTNIEITFMYLNILLIGLIVVLISISIIYSISQLLNSVINKKSEYIFSIVLITILSIIIINEYYFHKSSYLFACIFALLLCALTYYWNYINVKVYTKSLFILFASSILSITFMNFFNSTLEINSLKIIANEITGANSSMYEYYVENTLNRVESDSTLFDKNKDNNNYNSEAFLIWNNTSLSSEVDNATINIYDEYKNMVGSFSYGIPIGYDWDWQTILEKTIEVSAKNDGNAELEKVIIAGLIPIKNNENISGYVEVLAYYNTESLEENNRDIILGKNDPFNRLSVNVDLIKIYQFRNGKLSDYYTNTLLTKGEKEVIINSAPTKHNDSLLTVSIDKEKNVFYLHKSKDSRGEKLIAVGLSDKNLTWNLYDFFKVFFIHSIMIIAFFIIFYFSNYKNWNNLRITFKSKILISLLLVSIIPLLLLASYFKTISDEKNNEAINYKLGKRADNVEEYIRNYLDFTNLNRETIFDNASRDLGINFAVYENEEIIYSSVGTYYAIGLLPKLINPLAYIEINKYEMLEIILQEKIENYNYNSLYHKVNFAGHDYIIKISDLFNSYQLPMTGIELNVFLFGTYSLAIILIIILSTILANEISSPIEKLTKATQSVSHGDMSIQLKNYESGEVKELIDGFNLMVRELKKNQIELAEVERESAWREMAKQVAHEIKNPLTPMKLAVQHLVVAHKDKSEKFNSIFEKVTNTIITQIDILKNIASEFSSFAKMPSLKIENTNIVEIINATINLFIDEECTIKLNSKNSQLFVNTDKEQFQRMIVNLIRNSIQAKSNNISIEMIESDKTIELLVIDDGTGIPADVLPKIFDDNFTTKKEGMGLGLALSKRLVEQTNGNISVVSTSVKGTIIKVELVNINV